MKTDSSKWNAVAFGDVAKCLTIAVKDAIAEGLDRYVGLEHIEPGSLHIKAWGDVADGTTFTRVFRKGQVLFGKRRAYQKKAALAEFDGVCSGDILVCEAIDGAVLPELLPFIVQSDHFFNHAIKTSAGSLSPRTKFKDLAKFNFKLPSTNSEQKGVADLLWAIDAAQEHYIQLLNKLIVCKGAYFDEIHEEPKSSAESISTIAEINPRTDGKKMRKDTPISFIAMADVSEEGYILKKEDRLFGKVANGLTPFEDGDILFAKITPCMENGKGAIAVGLTNGVGFGSTEFHVLRPKSQDDLYYLFFLTMSAGLRKKAEQHMTGSAGQKRVPVDFFDYYKVRFPDINKRKRVGDQMKWFSEKIAELKNNISSVAMIKKQIINQMFGGL